MRNAVPGLLLALSSIAPVHAASDPCAPLPPPTGTTVHVTSSQAGELRAIVAAAATGTTILLADGFYDLSGGDAGHRLVFATPGVTLRSESGDRDGVILDGGYTTDELVSISASDVVIADLTLRRAYDHPIHVSGPGVPISGIVLHNLRIEDPGQQAVKVNPDGTGAGTVDDSVLRCSELVLTDAGRGHIRDSCYTGGLDAHHATGWHVHDVRVEGFWCPLGLSEHGIHFWRASADTLVERVTVLDCARGIGFGLGSDAADGHVGGIIRNCFVAAADSGLFGSEYGFDTGISLESASGAVVAHDTVVSTTAPRSSSIEWRWPLTDATVANNLVSDRLLPRNGATATVEGNLEYAPLAWFTDPTAADLHLLDGEIPAVDAGTAPPPGGATSDIDRQARDPSPDVGADEWLDPIFADGFESGDLTHWSEASP